jgi:hypothetical protein
MTAMSEQAKGFVSQTARYLYLYLYLYLYMYLYLYPHLRMCLWESQKTQCTNLVNQNLFAY